MYILDTLYYLYKPVRRKLFFEVSKQLSDGNIFKRLLIMSDMIFCSLVYGATFNEYGDLGFRYRTNTNRKTYLTTFYNFKFYEKVNKKEKRKLFHNKLQFLNKFSPYIKRDWLNLSTTSKEELANFIQGKNSIVLKNSMGDSGKEVSIIDLNEFDSIDSLLDFIYKCDFDLAEECITNCNELNKLNTSSLNTLRITTLLVNESVNIIFAGLRVGAKGAKIDNISQGGFVAKVDIKTGRICSEFYRKESSVKDVSKMKSIIGFQIPNWNEVLRVVNNLALIEKDVQFVSWDICVTPKGVDVIEGNESFGSVILQVFNGYDEAGLRPVVEKLYYGMS